MFAVPKQFSQGKDEKMKKGFAILLLFLVLLPVSARAGEELNSIKEKDATSKLYKRAIEFFTQKFPEVFRKRLDNSHKYIDLVIDIFQEKKVPLELAYLPLIESEFSPFSVGPGNAAGLWQFMRGTAKKYGLRVDRYVDERRDPVKSTYAAADYLRELYSKFGAWDIALAAYNAGEGKINSLFNRSGARLPLGINRYLASFMAASTVASNPEEFGFDPHTRAEETGSYREITTNRITKLKLIAEKFDTTVEAIKGLNPALLGNVTPPYPYTLKLPDD
jgi:peptidoglycan lytic transglycosylase D